ncbi:hypothetical protein TNCV_4865991 [Trichonephila clavipes]|nr:hypothetical protein TNCV_4865991 [Trichonephila clavipes]
MVEQQEVFSVYGFDFEDLFSSIKIEDIIEVLSGTYEKYGLNSYISFENFSTLIRYVMQENFIIFDNKLYKQIKGLPQGGAASNSLANLYIHHYESKRRNRPSCLLFRYIDDLIAIGRDREFKPSINFC